MPGPGPVVVVSPHLDDAVLSAWSVLRSEADVAVINVFSGVPARSLLTRYDRLVGGEESAPLFEQRLEEDREALALAGRTARGLGFLERQYREGPVDSEALSHALAPALRNCAELVLPSGIGGHEDHLAVRDVGFELAGADLPIMLYAELPYAIHKGWPHWVTGEDPDPHLDPESDWEHYLREGPWASGALTPTVRTLSEEEADAKLTALRAYRSQFSSLNSGTVNRFGNRAVRRHEVFWSVDAGAG